MNPGNNNTKHQHSPGTALSQSLYDGHTSTAAAECVICCHWHTQ